MEQSHLLDFEFFEIKQRKYPNFFMEQSHLLDLEFFEIAQWKYPNFFVKQLPINHFINYCFHFLNCFVYLYNLTIY